MKDFVLPNGVSEDYIKRRKRSVIMFYSFFYIFCTYFLLIKFDVIKNTTNTYWHYVSILFFLFTIFLLIYVDKCKRYYNKFDVPNHNGINIFKAKDIFLFLLPIFISSYFILLPVLAYSCFTAVIYASIKKVNRRPYYILNDPPKYKRI